MRIYMDNCCYNRPYDDQSQMRIHLETEAKLHIQDMVKKGEVELVASFALTYENGKNRFAHKRKAISQFMEANASYYVGMENDKQVAEIAEAIKLTGVKDMDAFHVACAIFSESDFFITTDDRVLKFQSEKVEIVNPVEFIRRKEENGDE
ncbi:hypothetical protein GN277_02595 [Lachnospiraceae bacterium WCA-9-b2]|uniref:PIN domain-containing protein n=1 Tax=Sporofaciens musculi TaxID=2681861 RepID=A0A7X3SHF3_9FIRM|nr:hypothetical protein [Sporofaciens musculi]MXP74349.1 hypothetical protein [Sporofaciens musculi]